MLSYEYTEEFESQLIRGEEEDTRPWDLIQKISIYLEKHHSMLDIGCGTAFKCLPLATKVKYCIGLEPNSKMQKKALKNAQNQSVTNFHLVGGYAQQLPFDNNTFDIVTAMLAPHQIQEIYRVLKPNGYVLMETIGEKDKEALKLEFGMDDKGWRGQLSNLKENEIYEKNKEEFERLFSKTTMFNGFWKTYYSREGIRLLLQQTPTVRGFDIQKDQNALESVFLKYSCPKGIEVTQHRILIIAKK